MTFDQVYVWPGPSYVAALWPPVWISVIVALTSLLLLYGGRHQRGRQVRRRVARRTMLALHAGLLCAVLLCSLLTLRYHWRVTEPRVRAYVTAHPGASSSVRRAADRLYLGHASAFGLALVAGVLALTARARRMDMGTT